MEGKLASGANYFLYHNLYPLYNLLNNAAPQNISNPVV